MKLDDLKIQWQKEIKMLNQSPSLNMQIEDVSQNMEKLEKQIAFRDKRETLLLLPAIPVFILIAWKAEHWISALGCLLTIALMLTQPFILNRAKPTPGTQLLSTKSYLENQLTMVNKQINLLNSIWLWSLLPLFFTVSLIYIGDNLDDLFKWTMPLYFGFIGIVFIAVYWLNARAVKKDLIPRKQELEKTLADLTADESK
ncbi:hypothetical protein N7931_15040 [Catenovulum sp. 2E275]|uniref:hypothetical protein n=1 Tax=Catenovulum sp. 2E275 TaxID=2980497 RepID=UPI0021CE3F88|nr:hypothetical protein [Catenovulum sp. 2E275]MCU4676948.1 hypothetical protein [Catenovulum sp. 2E275]